jgi:hypothetical protein
MQDIAKIGAAMQDLVEGVGSYTLVTCDELL